jgi:hypothetical protein
MAENPTTADLPAAGPFRGRAGQDLFVISVLLLFLELACIRWFPAHVLFLTFFTNTVLLACFLGLSLGCLAAGHRRNYLHATPAVLGLALLAALGVERLRTHLEPLLDVGHQASPQFVYFGTEYGGGGDVAHFVIPVEVLGGFFFVMTALIMVGPGQVLGRAMSAVPNRLRAYTLNILGSVVGVLLFSACSWWQLAPAWWFLFIAIGLAYFLYERPLNGSFAVRLAMLALIVLAESGFQMAWQSGGVQQNWSPYYRIDYQPQTRRIGVNLIGHQQMISRQAPHPAYALPYLLRRDAGLKPVQDVLIIGAGSGNDVSRSLQWGARHVDAVEIDPVIQRLGERDHPDRPYQEKDRVHVRLDDGRNFLRATDRQYDLISYALVDSLVLHSSYSNIRLESFLFTRQAFADVQRRLAPDGLFVMYNYFRQGWIVARLQKTLTETFGTPPLVLTLPYQPTVEPDKSFDGFALFIAGEASALKPLREALARQPEYWLDGARAPGPDSPNGFTAHSQEGQKEWQRFGLAEVHVPPGLEVATDDWPFLYLRQPMIPDLSLRGAALMGGLALLLLAWFAPPRKDADGAGWCNETRQVLAYWFGRGAERGTAGGFDGRMFFLGAGFILIETKAVVHMALLFGSTWMVNSVVFLAVLLMILGANVFVLKLRPRSEWLYYGGLFAALALNTVVPLDSFLGADRAVQVVGSCLLVFAPVLFAAVIFSISFDRTRAADQALGFNIAGAMLGGLAEYSSMYFGFQHLELVILAFYALSAVWVGGRRQRRPVQVEAALATAEIDEGTPQAVRQ